MTAAQLAPQTHQLKALIDICHLYGLAVVPDVVYNHAGGGFDAQSIDHFDFPADPDAANSQYFSAGGWAGGRVFAYDRPQVRDYLIGNALMWIEEYHADGLRFDEVSVIDSHGGWFFAQDLTDALRLANPKAAKIAEYWGERPWLGVVPPPSGMGFDLGYADGLRDAVRRTIAEAAGGAGAKVELDRLRPALERPLNFPNAWRAYNCIENHDLVLDFDGDHRQPRIPKLAHSDDPRSWYARSRSRVALGLLITAPGTPMLFMGQEFLEDKLWSDNFTRPELFIWWDGQGGQDGHMADFHRFASDLIWLRRRQPALRAEPINVFHVNQADRIVAFHRWQPAQGHDLVVVASLRETSYHQGAYRLGLPLPGRWREVLNSDLYDHFPNPWVHGNGGRIVADGPPLHGLPHSGGLTIPANGLLVLARHHEP